MGSKIRELILYIFCIAAAAATFIDMRIQRFVLAVQKFLFYALKYYFTEVDGVDFQNAPEEVRRRINLWVEVQTHG